MGTIVCQSCLNTIEHYEDEKVSVLFSNCCTCEHDVELDD
ncbi:GapA-binding peptide SR1P [Rossellomorea marisflavi]|uniref:GapA-binding peptide SR1P n=1 Tax=Rossellomorea marisflavi TaxID=189381 RepID=A0A5D4RRN4_9BACI|nr:GapA-binding peptide SR1P [Rossellomorea marisflavi]MBV6683096.1 GapA-binding peptide SR1P [Bacillus sp. JRC01]VXB62084.1 SR1 protein [Bacillus sp. 349Y]MDW4526335.1 GapA-binding peptide SR1P [Rossellomorea marisflavi]TYS54025.1 GapA-binding peptide SR1P [Rossellomorea marisflavi]UKS66987.1 GapA-binding peptide SR1P [Rossellomorea marisflavi]